MMKLILLLILFETCLCQMYIPRLSRDPNSRPSIVRFRRPPLRNLHSMEAAPSDTNSRLSLPKSEPFIPGAVAYASRPSDSVGEMSLTPRPHYNNYQFTPTEETKSPVQNVDFDGEALTSFQEEAPPLSIEPDNPEEQGFASSGAYEEAPFVPEDSIALGYSDGGNEFLSSQEKKEEINDEGNFHGEIVNNYEYVNNEKQGENNEQGRREEEAPSVEFNENINEENLGQSLTNENEEVTESSISNQDYVYEENNVESPEEYFEESPNKEEIKIPETEPESRTEIDLFEPFANSQVDQIQEFNSRESLNRPFEETSSTPVYIPFEHPSGTSKESPKLAKSAQSFYTHNQSPVYETKEDTYNPENRRRPTFNLRPTSFEQKEEERFPKVESKTNIFLSSERHEPKEEESVSSRSKYSSFNENSIQKFNSFSNTPRIISQPKYQAEESKKRRRPYKPFYEPTPAPYNEEENHLGDYQDYTDDNEKKEPDRLSTLLQQTKFNCLEKNDGYYADEQLECEVFHFCQDKVRHSWLCPSGSSFHQVHLICMPQSDDNICEKSSNFHFVNDYLYKETPESTGRNRTYVQRYYPKGYEGGIAFLEEQQSISKNPSLHKTLSPYEKQQFRQANNRRNPPRDYHPQHSVQAHERAPVRDRQKNDIPNYEEDISLERTPQRGYQQNDVNPYEEPQDFDISQTDYELDPDEAYDTHQTNFEEEIQKFKKPVTHEENNDYQLQPHEENNDYQLQPHKENNQYQLQPLLSTRHENVPFANTPTQGHIRRPQEMFPRPQETFILNKRNSENVRRVPHPFYRRLGNTFNQ